MISFICGKNSVIEAIENNLPIKTIYTNSKFNFSNISANIQIKYVNKIELDRLTNFANHQGFVAEIKEINYFDILVIEKDKPSKILVLDHIQDPYNLGAIIRSANASGVKHIIIPRDRAASVTPTVLKVASGGFVGMKIIRVNSIFDAVKKIKEFGYWIYSSALDEGAKKINEVVFNDPLVIIFGNEKTGVSSTLLKISDEKFYIPMKGTVQSLNVSVASGIILFSLI